MHENRVLSPVPAMPQVLQNMPDLKPSTFTDTLYRLKMFQLDDLVLGPYVRHCLNVGNRRRVGRSSMCLCNQGLRTVYLTEVTADYKFRELDDGMLSYPLSDCYATAENMLDIPILYTQYKPAGDPEAARTQQEFNRGVHFAAWHQDVRYFGHDIDATENMSHLVYKEVANSPTAAVVGAINIPEVPMHVPVVATFQSPARTSGPYKENVLHIFPTLQQEIYCWMRHIAQAEGAPAVHVVYRDGFDDAALEAVRLPAIHFGGKVLSAQPYSRNFNSCTTKVCPNHGGGGRPGPCMQHPPAPRPPWVLRDSGVAVMAPTAPKFFVHASLSSNHPCFERQISKTRRSTNVVCCKVKDHHNHCGHTYPSAAPASPAASPNPPQTHIPPGGMHVVVVGRA